MQSQRLAKSCTVKKKPRLVENENKLKWTNWLHPAPSFALMIEESMKFARQNPLQSYKVPHSHKFSGELLDKAYESTEKLVAPILAVQKKIWSNYSIRWIYM